MSVGYCALPPWGNEANGSNVTEGDNANDELAALDERHNTLSGPATKKLCERAFTIFKQTPYQRLAGILSSAHGGKLVKLKTGTRAAIGSLPC